MELAIRWRVCRGRDIQSQGTSRIFQGNRSNLTHSSRAERFTGGGNKSYWGCADATVYWPLVLCEERDPVNWDTALGLPMWGGLLRLGWRASTSIRPQLSHSVAWVRLWVTRRACRLTLLPWFAFQCILTIPFHMGHRSLLQAGVWKADCRLSGLENEGGGWFITGKLCADYNHVEKQCGFYGVHSGTSAFPPGTRPLLKKKTYLG